MGLWGPGPLPSCRCVGGAAKCHWRFWASCVWVSVLPSPTCGGTWNLEQPTGREGGRQVREGGPGVSATEHTPREGGGGRGEV